MGFARRRLIVNADDFGRSRSINEAVIQAHREGILTSASLMVNGAAVDEAVDLARLHPNLGVGLHLTLCCGQAALPPNQIPALVNGAGVFTSNPVKAGLRYFFNPQARQQLEVEILRQLEKFSETGLPMDHLNGHLQFHLHPVVFRIVERHFSRFGVRSVRLTFEPWEMNFLKEKGRWGYRLSHALIFMLLSRSMRARIEKAGVAYAPSVFGLLQDSLVDEDYLLRLIPDLPAGDSELYSHPSLDQFKHELVALISPRVAALLRQERVSLIRYQDI